MKLFNVFTLKGIAVSDVGINWSTKVEANHHTNVFISEWAGW